MSNENEPKFPLKNGDRIWRPIRCTDGGYKRLIVSEIGAAKFKKSDKGDFMARVRPKSFGKLGVWEILDWEYDDFKGDSRATRGIVCILPANEVKNVSDKTLSFVVTGVGKKGNVVFIKPDDKATLKDFVAIHDFLGSVPTWPWQKR